MGIDADMFNSPEWMSEALRIGNTGLWAIEIDEENGKHRMTANETMLLLLGLETHPSPEDCFRHWYGRVDEAYRAAVDECVGKMLSTGQRYEVQYPWLHPVCGRIFVRCGGKLLPGRSKNGLLRLKGYHQDVSELESMRERLRENLSRFETACRIGRIGVAILLTLLALGVKNIHLGPSLPAFVSPDILNLLVENWGIKPISTPDEDLKALLG